MFFCTPRAVPEMYTISESLSLKKITIYGIVVTYRIIFFSVQVVVFQCKIRHILIIIGLALAVSDRLDDTLYHDSLINLALCVIFIEAKFN